MTLTVARWVSALTLALGCSILATGSAEAARLVLDDASGDVWSPKAGSSGHDNVGTMVNTDVRSTMVAHRAENVVVAVQYARLTKRASDEITFTAYCRTSDKRMYEVQAQVDWLGRNTYLVVSRGINGTHVDCPDARGRARFDLATLRVVVPRSCLSSPRWVRFSGTAEPYEESAGLSLDGATSEGAPHGPWTDRIPWG